MAPGRESHAVPGRDGTDQARLAPLFLALLDEVLRVAFTASAERRAASGSPFCRPDGTSAPRLLVMLDEAANIAPLPDLAALASTAGGEGVQLVTIYQDLSQLRHRYGTEWGSIASNHVAKVILPGVSDPETLRYFSTVIGDEEFKATSTTTGAGRTTTTASQQRRSILSQRDLRELELGSGVCLYGARPAIRLGLRQAATMPVSAEGADCWRRARRNLSRPGRKDRPPGRGGSAGGQADP